MIRFGLSTMRTLSRFGGWRGWALQGFLIRREQKRLGGEALDAMRRATRDLFKRMPHFTAELVVTKWRAAEIYQQVLEAAARAAFEAAKGIESDARSRAPVRTGKLRESIRAKPGDRGTATVDVDRKIAPHSHLVEFGTPHMSARPFFRPAVDRGRAKFKSIMARELRRIF